ncbi:MAG: methionyl-tRNA formyltransferase [Candidatus Eremiobacteraeota bacterium]|nr:methionyl-tRNA formyltransferase [Candidatus Eremiobacteraeota bacterium]
MCRRRKSRKPKRSPCLNPSRRRPFRKPRTVFFGTSDFALPSLQALAAAADVTLVVTQPDAPSGRGQRLQPTPVKRLAGNLGLPSIEPLRLRDALAVLREREPDLFAVISYGKIVSTAALEIPRWLALNVHPSLLPLYRGATPLRAVLRDGRAETGVTVIAMDAGMDTGDIVLQERMTIAEHETYGELHDRCAAVAATLLLRATEAAVEGRVVRTAQAAMGCSTEEIAATATRPLEKADLFVDWDWAALRIVNHVRSLAPVPLARAVIGSQALKIVSAHVASPAELNGPATVVAGDGSGVVLETVVPPNRSAMSGAAFLRAVRIG